MPGSRALGFSNVPRLAGSTALDGCGRQLFGLRQHLPQITIDRLRSGRCAKSAKDSTSFSRRAISWSRMFRSFVFDPSLLIADGCIDQQSHNHQWITQFVSQTGRKLADRRQLTRPQQLFGVASRLNILRGQLLRLGLQTIHVPALAHPTANGSRLVTSAGPAAVSTRVVFTFPRFSDILLRCVMPRCRVGES